MYAAAMRKLTVSPNELSNEEKTFLLTTALICLRKYKEDRRIKSYNELAFMVYNTQSFSRIIHHCMTIVSTWVIIP